MFSNLPFDGQIVVVTGGATGIGYAIAKLFLQNGATVVIASRKEENLREAQQELSAFGACHYHATDIRVVAQVEALADFVAAEFGRLDILINNAGGQFTSPAESISPNGWNAVINNNLNGTWFMIQTMANRFFIPQRKGIITTIIVNILRGFPGMAHTGAARAGIENLIKTLSVEWARHNIRLNAVAPGIINSTGLDNYPPEFKAMALETLPKKIPMQRLGTTDEVAYSALFLSMIFWSGQLVSLLVELFKQKSEANSQADQAHLAPAAASFFLS